MAIVNLLAKLPRPGGLWPIIISGIDAGVGNFGWTILIFTIIVKLALTPFDFLMRWSSKKNTLVQKKLKPQIDKINKKYANDKQKANMQTQALYKKEGVHVIGSCLFSVVYLALTIAVFFTLFASLRKYSAYQVLNQYDALKTTYYETIEQNADLSEAEQVAKAEKAVQEKWNNVQDGWLWVSNIWQADTQVSPVPSYKSLQSSVKSAKDKKATAEFKKISKAEYNKIMGCAKKTKNSWNGYYVLAVLALGLTFLSQWISELGNKVKREKKQKTNKFYQPADDDKKKKDPSNSTAMKVLKYVMPLIMVFFVMTSSAAFGIYIVASSLISTLTNLLINYLVRLATKKQEKEVLEVLEKQELKESKKMGANK